jgi:hypothetical protein
MRIYALGDAHGYRRPQGVLVDRFAKGAAVELVMSQTGHFQKVIKLVTMLTMLSGSPATDSRASEHPKDLAISPKP